MGIQDLVGETLESVSWSINDSEMLFITADGIGFRVSGCQNCKSTNLAINGNINDLIDEPITAIEETLGPAEGDDFQFKFFHIHTKKGLVVLRWYGETKLEELGQVFAPGDKLVPVSGEIK